MRIFLKLAAGLLLLGMLAWSGRAAGAAADAADADSGAPVQVALAVRPQGAEPPAERVVELTISIEPSWHIYGRVGGSAGQRPLEIDAKPPEGTEFVGDWTWPKPQTVMEDGEVEIYEGIQVFTRRLRVTKEKAGAVLSATVAYQACNAELCGPPQRVRVSAAMASARSRP